MKNKRAGSFGAIEEYKSAPLEAIQSVQLSSAKLKSPKAMQFKASSAASSVPIRMLADV